MYSINDQILQLLDMRINEGTMTERKLCNGLCARSVIRNLHHNSVTDYRTLRILIQRLGKSANKLIIIAPQRTLEQEIMQYNFDEFIDKNDWEDASILLSSYKESSNKPTSSITDKIYYLRNLITYTIYCNSDLELALSYVSELLNLTMPNFTDNNLDSYAISTIEIEHILQKYMLLLKLDCGRFVSSEISIQLKALYTYINKNITDYEELSQIMPKYHWVMANYYIYIKEYEKAVYECESGLVYLRKASILHLMMPLLDIIISHGQNITFQEPFDKYVPFYNTLKQLISICECNNYKFDSLLMNCRREIFYYDAEIFSAQRKMNNLSQQSLADKLNIDTDVISRFEHGHRTPNKNTYQRIMNTFGLERGRQNAILVGTDFNSLETEHKASTAMLNGDYDTARVLIKTLANSVCSNNKRNNNIITVYINDLLMHESNPNYENILDKDLTLLANTYPIMNQVIVRPPFEDEVRLIAQIGICYTKLNRTSEGIHFLEKVLNTIDKSIIDKRLINRIYGLLKTNYIIKTANTEIFTTALGIDTLKYELKCRSIDGCESVLSSMAIKLYNTDKKLSKQYMTMNYYLSLLCYKESSRIAKDNLEQFYQ